MSQARWVIIAENFKISETIVVSWLIIGVMALISFLLTRNLKKVPTSKVQLFLEFIVTTIANLVTDSMGEKIVKKMPWMISYIGSLFIFIAASNLAGLFGFRIPTLDLNTTLAWSLMTLIMIYLVGVKLHGPGYFKTLLEPYPALLPLNLIGEISKPISMAFRPFGNILGGSVIMALAYQFLGEMIPTGALFIAVPMHLYFDLFAGVLQAFIFIMLTMVFVGSAAE